MTTITLSVPESTTAFIDAEVASGAYDSREDFLVVLLMQAQLRKAKDRIDGLILEGLASGESSPMTSEDWAELRQELAERLKDHERS